MFYIIETENSFDKLKGYINKKVFLEVILSSNNFHPKLSKLLALYIRPIEEDKGYILPLGHPDGLDLKYEEVVSLLESFEQIYVLDKKRILYFLKLKNLKDIQFLRILNGKETLKANSDFKSYNWYYTKYYNNENIGSIIPLVLHYKNCENIFEQVKESLDLPESNSFSFYNNDYTYLFFLIEQGGLKVEKYQFIEAFKPNNPDFNIKDDIVYTYYNLYNYTSRPTNSFNTVNFSAIPHKDEYRKCIVPKNDYFIEFDFDGYHLRLLSEILEYELTDESAHKQIAKQYYNKDVISEEEYKEVKQLNFQAIYGKIPEEYNHIKLFQLAKKYIDQLWGSFNDNGYVNSPISNKPFFKGVDSMHPQKLMNYVIQNLETTKNVMILKEVLRFLKNKKSDIVLYTYDSFLLDFSKGDGKETLESLFNILTQENKYPVHIKSSQNLVF